MSDRLEVPSALLATGVVAIARAASASRVEAAVEALVGAGVTCIEVPLTTPGAVATIASLVTTYAGSACIGAGTVLTTEQASACIDAGAAFLVSPSAVPEVVKLAAARGVPSMPGALTPTEIVAAWASGAAAVKLFPASLGGVRYLRDVRAPLPDIALLPTGGIAIDDVTAYVDAGAIAIGVGGPLFGDALDGGDLDALAARGRRFLAVVAEARQARGTAVR
ncbi:MAG TPA: bifunctional 4-hydroxy-2-oxoglutarate aldolase/2-dehydro-3-deoxy-phosphogluconate aldolase [Acidothermaceae bacterium]